MNEFVPEKIERWDCEASGNVVEASDGQYIRAADYDKLLALYREATKFNGPHLLTDKDGNKARCCGDPNGCEWCAVDKIYFELKAAQSP